jgi:WD40 repeat protein
MPAGPGKIGQIYAVAISPDGNLVAAGGWTESNSQSVIYLFNRSTGAMQKRLADPTNVTLGLSFSSDGRYLAATVGGGEGLYVFDRDRQWAEVRRDAGYDAYGVAFHADGRLATASLDGTVRLYDPTFRLIASHNGASGDRFFRLAFSPDGAALAVGHTDSPAIVLLDARTLRPMPGPNTDGLIGAPLSDVAWSADGQTLFAGGAYPPRMSPIFAWHNKARNQRYTFAHAPQTISGLQSISAGRLLVTTLDPYIALLNAEGGALWTRPSGRAEFIDQGKTLAVSDDGNIVDFYFDPGLKAPLRFDVRALKLSAEPPADGLTQPPRVGDDVNVSRLGLVRDDRLRSTAFHTDRTRFVIATSFSLQAQSTTGEHLWRRQPPAEALAVNISGDGRIVVAAYADSTIRWHRMDDGRELLAFMVLPNRSDWVVWTPEGFYEATAGAQGVLRWHVNRGPEAAADSVPIYQIPRLNRPDAIRYILQEMETFRALGIAEAAATRTDVQRVTGAAQPPGARLHLLTIGISDYGDKAMNLRLKFADKDATDVFHALVSNNREGGLYARVLPDFLTDQQATRTEIFKALDAMRTNMQQSSGNQDLAVVMFSGHGFIVEGQFYLMPYGVNTQTPADIESTAILVSQLRSKLESLGQYGRVLLLLDACRSGTAAGQAMQIPRADLLQLALKSINNVTVLTSSQADKLSREDDAWKHGAFTKVLLEAFGPDADTDHNGAISVNEMVEYVAKHLPPLTNDEQVPGMEVHFSSDILVVAR